MPNINKLTALLNHVTQLDEDDIDMNHWASDVSLNECGSSACLGGHATTVFPDELKLMEEWESDEEGYFDETPSIYIAHRTSKKRDDAALNEVFGLREGHGLWAAGRLSETAIADLRRYINKHLPA